jgi:hypothetical protein
MSGIDMRKRRSPKVRWTRTLQNLRAISVRQPWAWLIVNGYKDVENRSWQTRHRGPILIHAGAATSDLDTATIDRIERRYGLELPDEYEVGGIVGVVDIVDCKRRTDSLWHVRGNIGWVMSRPRLLKFRECKGALGLFRPELGRS